MAWVLGSVALFSAGAAASWWFVELREPEVAVTTVTAVVDRPVVVQQASVRGNGRVPDVVGLTNEQAQQVLVDAGLLPEQVERIEQASARPVGEVLGQNPDPGVGIPGIVTIWVSTPAEMPNLDGQMLDEARAELQALGAPLSVERRFVVGAEPEQIVETVPRAGEPLEGLEDEVQLVVAAPGASVFANELRSNSSSDCSFEDATIGGVRLERAIVCDPDRDDIPHLEYLIGPETAALQGVLGRPLDSDLGVAVEVRIFADARLAFQERIISNNAIDLDVDVSNASRVRLEMERIDGCLLYTSDAADE